MVILAGSHESPANDQARSDVEDKAVRRREAPSYVGELIETALSSIPVKFILEFRSSFLFLLNS